MPHEKLLGEILVEHGIISSRTRDRVLHRSQILGRRFGSVLEELELINGDELAVALAMQYKYKIVRHFASQHVDPALLEMIPVMVALQHMLFPLKKEEGLLFLAMADPTDTEIVEKIASIDNLKILPFVATKHEVRLAICRHYLNKELTKATERTVLVADPDRADCTKVKEALGKDHYRVLTALDGMDAFRKIIAETPHVIIADQKLPKLDAYGLLKSLKNIPEVQYVPLVIIGENGQEGEGESRSFAAGAFDFIQKPFTEQALRARVKRAFHFYDHQYRLF